MAINQKANVDVTLNNEQAKKEMEELQTSMKKFSDLRDQAFKSGNTTAWKAYDAELKKATRTASGYKKELFDVDKVIRNMSGSSLNDLKKAQAALTAEVGKLDRSTAQYARRSQDLKKVKAEMTAINNETKATVSLTSRMADGFNKYLGLGASLIAGIAGISMTVKGAIQGFNDYEERVANLSSLTGLAGDDLKYLSDQAKELATSTEEGGVLITAGSQQIVDAFTKVGSARPELLKNKEALVEVTKNAMILSAASKEELQPSIEALTMVMNQYNTSASEARRIINTIAAGSKAGAGEIPYITTAFEKAGTVAADAGISIETLVATIETLAPRISQPEIAGRSLKGVLLDLQTGADDTNPAIVGMSTALENLAKKNLSVTELTKLFGVENVTTAKILINNVAELKKYEAAVTGTNTAIEQGAINTDTNNARLAQAKERIKQVSDELGGKLSPIYGSIISKSSMLLKGIVAIVDFLIKYGRVITSVAFAIAGYTAAVKIAANWTKIQTAYTITASAVETAYGYVKGVLTGKIRLATVAQQAWNLALKANPIGLIIGLLAGAVAWLINFDKKTGKVSEALKKVGDVMIDLGNYFIELYNSSLPIRVAVQYLIGMWKTGFEAVKLVVKSLWEELKLGGKLLKAVFTFDFKGIKEALSEFATNNKNNIVQSAQNVAETWETAFSNAMKGKLKPISKKQNVIEIAAADPISENIIADSTGVIDPEDEQDDKSDGTSGSGSSKISKEEEQSVERLGILQNEIDTRAALLAKMDSQDSKHLMDVENTQKRIRDQYDQNIEKYKQELEAREEIGNAIIDISGRAIDVLIDLAGKETAAGKALFLLNQARAVGEVIFNTAIANAKAVAAFPITAGQPWVTINTVSAGVSIASILAQSISSLKSDGGGSRKNSSKIGAAHFSEGGYTGDGGTNEPAGIVHRGEYVMPQWMVQDRKMTPVIDFIETNRRNNRMSSIDMRAISAATASRGYASGGFVQSQANVQPVPPVQIVQNSVDEDMKALLKANMEMMAALRDKKLVVYSEMIKKDIDTLNHINKNRNL
jgi:TP901 family phage tail tape measure protein